jgi:hypothetical protein
MSVSIEQVLNRTWAYIAYTLNIIHRHVSEGILDMLYHILVQYSLSYQTPGLNQLILPF